MRTRELGLRSVIVAGAIVFGLLSASPFAAIFGLLAIANVGDLAGALLPTEDPVAKTGGAAMAVVVLLIVTGLVLNEVPGGLTTTNWAIGWGVVGIVAILIAHRGRRRSLLAGRAHWAGILAVGVLALGTAGGLAVAWSGVRHLNRQPLLELSAPWHSATQARITVHSVANAGRYRVQVLPDGQSAHAQTAAVVTLSTGTARVSRWVALPQGGATHWNLVLSPVNTASPRRELILWR